MLSNLEKAKLSKLASEGTPGTSGIVPANFYSRENSAKGTAAGRSEKKKPKVSHANEINQSA